MLADGTRRIYLREFLFLCSEKVCMYFWFVKENPRWISFAENGMMYLVFACMSGGREAATGGEVRAG